jgi:hypothetical protein
MMHVRIPVADDAMADDGAGQRGRTLRAVVIPEPELRRLYLDEGLSAEAVAARLGCTAAVVLRRLRAAGIERRPSSHPRYPRRDFDGDEARLAYLLGFRVGDLHVACTEISVVVKCTSTRKEQVDLFRALFEPYGHIYTSEAEPTIGSGLRKAVRMQVHLNRSFEFLAPKEDRVPEWVLGDEEAFFAYFAGYFDAEGYVQTRLPKGYHTPQVRVEVRSYEWRVLQQLAQVLNRCGIACPEPVIRVAAGYTNKYGVRSNGALWGLAVCRSASLHRLFQRIEPYVRHDRRRRDMMRAWEVTRAKLARPPPRHAHH